MGVISFRVADEIETKLREKAKIKKQNFSEFCRERVIEEKEEVLDKITLQNRIDNIEEVMVELVKSIQYNSAFIKAIIVMVVGEEKAEIALQNVLKMYNKEGD